MKITLHNITIGEVVDGFEDNGENGVVGYHGQLNIRPPYQREFIYNDKEKKAVIDSIFKDFPLNVMYWVKNDQGGYELLDGQQRTMSIRKYKEGDFSIELDGVKYFDNLTAEKKKNFLDYKLQIYICEDGNDQERINWFRIINIAGEELTDQEMRNAVYTGPWVTDAKRRFSRTNCVAYGLGRDYMTGSPIRQDYLERVLKWISKGDIETYMAVHQHDENSDREWQYFQSVIAWVRRIFTTYRNEMKGVEWGDLYNRFKDIEVSATNLEKEVARLMMDDDVTNKKGIYDYVLSRNEKKLNIREFSKKMKLEAYERQTQEAKSKGIGNCPSCVKAGGANAKKIWRLEEMQGDHITPWSQGGKTTSDNCQMLCAECNRRKSDM